MPTDLTALHAHLSQQLEGAAYNLPDITDHAAVAAWGSMLSGLATALAAVRAELDREREAAACPPPAEKPSDDKWTPQPVDTVWGWAEWDTTDGYMYTLCVIGRDDYIARISQYDWRAYRGPEGLDGVIDSGDATSLRDAHARAIAALRAAGSLA